MGPERAEDVAKGRYACPKCGNTVVIHVVFTGWEDERIDPYTEDAYRRVTGGREVIHDIEYFCPRYQCDWEGDEEWFDSVGEDDEEEIQNNHNN